MAAYGGTGSISGSSYGDLSKNDAFTIQKKMLPIAKRLLTFAKFAQKETKPQKQGLEIRHRRYERFPVVDTPIAEGVTPDFSSLEHTTLMHTLKQYGSYVNTTDVQLAAAADPVLKIISERQATQAGETIDFLSYKVFRAGTQVKWVGTATTASRADVDFTIGNIAPTINDPSTGTQTLGAIQTAIRVLEQNDAQKLKSKLKASVGISTEPIRESYIAICHPDLRQDVQQLPGFVPIEKYPDQGDVIEGEIGGVEGVRFITTTQATPFKDAGDTSNVAATVSTGGVNSDVYPVLIIGEDAIGCATLGGMDSLRSKVVMPKPGPGDPLGQRGTVAWDTFYSCIILQDLNMYRLEVVCTKLT
jgi:N4-gp56 family major capsid protein